MNKKKILISIFIVILISVSILLINKITSEKAASDKVQKIDDNKKVEKIEDIYESKIASSYQDVQNLPQDYSLEEAQKDKCFIVGAMIHNEDVYEEFMNKYENKEDSFIRIVQTKDKNLFLIDLLYSKDEDKVYLIKDNTRDISLPVSDRKIEYKIYDKIGTWKYNNKEYLVAYNGILPSEYEEDNINSDIFIILTVY